MTTHPIVWRKSSRSSSGGNVNCVEVGPTLDAVAIRDSKDVNGPTLSFDYASWSRVVAAVKSNNEV